MRSSFTPGQERTLGRSARESALAPTSGATTREIPYDYVAKFLLEGVRGRRQQDVINISVEGAFIASAIAYGFIPKAAPLSPGISQPEPTDPTLNRLADTTIGFPASLTELVAEVAAIELSSRLSAANLPIDKDEARAHLASVLSCAVRHVCGIDFKYSIVDSGTGRELQNQPVHNIAGLGDAGGARPFRSFPKPMLFLPRSTIRIEVEEVSQGPLYAGAELQIVLHGYKRLGLGV